MGWGGGGGRQEGSKEGGVVEGRAFRRDHVFEQGGVREHVKISVLLLL